MSFNLSTNTTESVSSSLINACSRTEPFSVHKSFQSNNGNSQSYKVPHDLLKSKANPLKSSSSSGLMLDNEGHKISSLGSLAHRHISPNKHLLSKQSNVVNTKIETLILVVHGGNVTCTDTSKSSDFMHFKSTMEALVKAQYSNFNERIAYRLVSCESICKEALIMLSTLSSIANEPIVTWNDSDSFAEQSAEAFSLNENLPFGTIPLLISANQTKYKENLTKFTKECNKVYNEFINSNEGTMFQGSIVLIGDSVGSLLVYDALCLNTAVFSNFDETSSTTSSVHNYRTPMTKQFEKRSSTKTNSSSPSPSPTLNRNPLININDTNADLVDNVIDNKVHRCNSSLSNSSGLEFTMSSYLTPPSPTLTPTLTKIAYDERLDFDVTHFFVFGSPLGLILASRKLANKSSKLQFLVLLFLQDKFCFF